MAQGSYMRNNRRRRRGRKIIGTVAFLLTVFSVATVICLAMFFNTTEIFVTGITAVPPQELIAASGLVHGQNIFAFDSNLAANTIYQKYPQMDTVKIRRRLPTTLEIAVVETTPMLAAVSSAQRYSLLGGNDRILMHKEDVSTEGLPILLGLDLTQLPAGATVTQKELDANLRYTTTLARLVRSKEAAPEALEQQKQYNELLHTAVNKLTIAIHLMDAAEEAGLEHISYYDVSDDLAVTLLYDHRILLELGTELDLQYKMDFAVRVIGELEDNFSGTIDLSTAGNNSRVYTREQNIEPLLHAAYREGYY